MRKRVREGSVTRLMEQTVLDTQKARAKPRPHNKFTVKPSEVEIAAGDAFRRSMADREKRKQIKL